RPLGHAGDFLGTGPGEAFAADANAVTHRLAAGLHEVEIGVGRIDDDRADRLARLIVHKRAAQIRRQLLGRASLGTILRRQRRVDAALLRAPFLRLLLAADRRRRTQDVEWTRQYALSRLRLRGWRRLHGAVAAAWIRLVSRRLLAIVRPR